jgi:hypothetical protein
MSAGASRRVEFELGIALRWASAVRREEVRQRERRLPATCLTTIAADSSGPGDVKKSPDICQARSARERGDELARRPAANR